MIHHQNILTRNIMRLGQDLWQLTNSWLIQFEEWDHKEALQIISERYGKLIIQILSEPVYKKVPPTIV